MNYNLYLNAILIFFLIVSEKILFTTVLSAVLEIQRHKMVGSDWRLDGSEKKFGFRDNFLHDNGEKVRQLFCVESH